ncbi:MAG TPA: response regulator [Acidimicrobiales bacterium]
MARRLAATERVLVVEDEHDIADFLRAYFRASGYDLVHIDPDTPLQVLDALDEHKPDCVLLDLNLRGFSGAEAYRLLRTEDRYALLPVIVVSARPDARQLMEATGGVDAFVSKPFNVNSLADLVADRIASASRLTAEAGLDPVTGLLGHEFVEARMADEITVAAPDGPTVFALGRLLSVEEILTDVGQEGLEYVNREIVGRARRLLPAEVTFGLARGDELAMLVPGFTAEEALERLAPAMDDVGEIELPGGYTFSPRFAVGIACYPDHASNADELYMAADAALAVAVESNRQAVIAL